jgi:ATP-binding cassette subfamily B (MDR/TAP) protein 8
MLGLRLQRLLVRTAYRLAKPKLAFSSALLFASSLHKEGAASGNVSVFKHELALQPRLRWSEFACLLRRHLALLVSVLLSTAGATLSAILSSREIAQLIEALGRAPDIGALQAGCLRVLVLSGVNTAFTFMYTKLSGELGDAIAKDLRLDVFGNLMHDTVRFFDEHTVADLLARMQDDVHELRRGFKALLQQGTRAAVQVVTGFGQMWMISPNLTLGLAACLPVVFGSGHLYGEHLRRLSKAIKAKEQELVNRVHEALLNIRTVKAHVAEEYELQRYFDKSRALAVQASRYYDWFGGFLGGTQLAFGSIATGILYFGGIEVVLGRMAVGSLVSFLFALQTGQRALTDLVALNGRLGALRLSLERIQELTCRRSPLAVDNVGLGAIRGEIEFRNVSFAYPGRSHLKVLNEANILIRENEVVAIIGESGSGKSTLAALLERFYDADSGAVFVDGCDVQAVSGADLRQSVGFIPQEPVLFSATLRENIAYGIPEGAVDDAAIVKAASAAQIHDFIMTLPGGYDTQLSRASLSGGQKQRIAIARVLLRKPRILILDEATSALDAESEARIFATLAEAFRGRTVIIITHNRNHCKLADRTYQLKEGKFIQI